MPFLSKIIFFLYRKIIKFALYDRNIKRIIKTRKVQKCIVILKQIRYFILLYSARKVHRLFILFLLFKLKFSKNRKIVKKKKIVVLATKTFQHIREQHWVIQNFLNLSSEQQDEYIFIISVAQLKIMSLYKIKNYIKIRKLIPMQSACAFIIKYGFIFPRFKIFDYEGELLRNFSPECNITKNVLEESNFFGVKDFQIKQPEICDEAKQKIDKFLQHNDLIDKKNVLFYLNSNYFPSFDLLENKQLIDYYISKGYNVLLNDFVGAYQLGKIKKQYEDKLFLIFFSLEEMYYLSSLCKNVVGLRNGIFDVLSVIPNINMHILHNGYQQNEILMKFCDLKVLTNNNNIYNYSSYDDWKSSVGLYKISSLPHTWIFDVDGTIVEHNGHLKGADKLLGGAIDFFNKIPLQDTIILLTAREDKYLDDLKQFLAKNGIRYNYLLGNMPLGERILINDIKPSGLKTAFAINKIRDEKLSLIDIKIDNDL